MSTTRKINWDDYRVGLSDDHSLLQPKYIGEFTKESLENVLSNNISPNTVAENGWFIDPANIHGSDAVVHKAIEGQACNPQLSFDEQSRDRVQLPSDTKPCQHLCHECLKRRSRECG